MKMSETISKITKALVKFRSIVPNISKNSSAHKYKYADLTEVLETITPALTECGIAFVQNNHYTDTAVGVSTIITCEEEYMIFDPVMIHMEKSSNGRNIAQETGTDITYARRYSLCTALGLATEDTDGIKQTPEPNKTNQNKNNYQKTSNSMTQKTQTSMSYKQDSSNVAEFKPKADKEEERKKEMGKFHAICSKHNLNIKQKRAIVYLHTGKSQCREATLEELREVNKQINGLNEVEITFMISEAAEKKRGAI